MLVPFAALQPDIAELNTGVATVARNVLPSSTGYVPVKAAADLSEALPATCCGAFAARALDGSPAIFAGTATGLYKLNTSDLTWENVSRTSGGAYNASTDNRWSFAQFGNQVIAVNPNDDAQVYEIGVSSDFEALGGTPPRAALVGVWGDYVVLGRLTDYPNAVHWSDFNDPENWTPGAGSLSDMQEFPDGGRVMGFSSSTNPIIIQETAIRRGVLVPGDPAVFSFDKIADGRGCNASPSVVTKDDMTFFLATDGFWSVTAAGGLKAIGYEKVDKTLLAEMATNDSKLVIAAADPLHTRVYFGYRTPSASADTLDRIAVYDYSLDRWSTIEQACRFFIPAATTGYTLDGLDTLGYTLETLPYSLDSAVWSGGTPVLAVITNEDKLAFFQGAAMEAVIETGEFGERGIQMVRSVQPVIDTNAGLVQVGSRFRRGDARTWTGEKAVSGATGIAHLRSRARFHRIRLKVPASTVWTHAQGVDVDAIDGGAR